MPEWGCHLSAGVEERNIVMIPSFMTDENGAAAAEHALVMALVGAVIVLATFTLGSAVAASMTQAIAEVSEASPAPEGGNGKGNGNGNG